MPAYQIKTGDCRDELRSLGDCSVDSIVTDPPYELGFMGKGWDRSGIAYNVEVWKECLRVLKPGGHLLAFGGSRTYHRLACAIEDAGFEIRDQIQYIYGSGFPKSLNVSKNLREQESVCICDEYNSNLRQLQGGISDVESVVEAGQSADLFAPMQRSISGSGVGHARPQGRSGLDAREFSAGGDAWVKESCMEGRRDGLQEEGELYGRALRASTGVGEANGPQGRLRDGAPFSNGPNVRIPSHSNGSGQSPEPQALHQRRNESRTVADECGSQTWGGWPICPRCSKPIFPEGLGSALKPAHEPIVLARKSLTSTLIENVLQHGTGGLNIDGCRIETADGLNGGAYLDNREKSTNQIYGEYARLTPNDFVQPAGRWPANVIHDGSQEVLARFPDEAGANGGNGNFEQHAWMRELSPQSIERSKGSAARFFYCAKASKEDREDGCESLPLRSAGEVTDRKDGTDGLNSPRAGAGRTNGSRNHHPTVKPTDLMRYLCRLVTPPNGTVLDPFCGSGSTGRGAVLEGFNFIGIELDAQYCELAERRIEAVTRQGMLMFA